jgi:hypothetical protein
VTACSIPSRSVYETRAIFTLQVYYLCFFFASRLQWLSWRVDTSGHRNGGASASAGARGSSNAGACLIAKKRANSRDRGPSTPRRSYRTRHSGGSRLLGSADRRRDRFCCRCLVLAPMTWLASVGLALILGALVLRWHALYTAAALELSGDVLYSDGDTTGDVLVSETHRLVGRIRHNVFGAGRILSVRRFETVFLFNSGLRSVATEKRTAI